MKNKNSESVTFTRINNDINGNPRYVCHFLSLVNDEDRTHISAIEARNSGKINGREDVPTMYGIALGRARKLGGRKFHNKQYGGGIVFQSYNNDILSKEILRAASVSYVSFYECGTGEDFELLAVFPYQQYSELKPGWVNVYSRIGQHSGAHPDYIKGGRKLNTRSKKDRARYADLALELEIAGYILEII